jgi:hypothetical protein
MNKQELEKGLEALEQKHRQEVHDLRVSYARANQEYHEGDILQSEDCIILVDAITVGAYLFEETPQCIYKGVKLRKSNLTPYKNGEREVVFQHQVIKKLN